MGGTREQYEQLEYTEPVTVETRNLIDHLREQLQMLTLTPRQLLLAEEFLGNINEEGYLAASLEEILGSVNQLMAGHVGRERRGRRGRRAETTRELRSGSPLSGSATVSAVADSAFSVLSVLSALLHHAGSRGDADHHPAAGPLGTGARDLRECLLIQLVELAGHQLTHLPAGE